MPQTQNDLIGDLVFGAWPGAFALAFLLAGWPDWAFVAILLQIAVVAWIVKYYRWSRVLPPR